MRTPSESRNHDVNMANAIARKEMRPCKPEGSDSYSECFASALTAMEVKNDEFKQQLTDFIEACKPLDADIQKIVNEHFADLLG